jgi:hypothetical protein
VLLEKVSTFRQQSKSSIREHSPLPFIDLMKALYLLMITLLPFQPTIQLKRGMIAAGKTRIALMSHRPNFNQFFGI